MDADEIEAEIAHQRTLFKEYRKRLRVLEQQAAKFGDAYVPAYIQVEIEDIHNKLRECKRKVLEYSDSITPVVIPERPKENKPIRGTAWTSL